MGGIWKINDGWYQQVGDQIYHPNLGLNSPRWSCNTTKSEEYSMELKNTYEWMKYDEIAFFFSFRGWSVSVFRPKVGTFAGLSS